MPGAAAARRCRACNLRNRYWLYVVYNLGVHDLVRTLNATGNGGAVD